MYSGRKIHLCSFILIEPDANLLHRLIYTRRKQGWNTRIPGHLSLNERNGNKFIWRDFSSDWIVYTWKQNLHIQSSPAALVGLESGKGDQHQLLNGQKMSFYFVVLIWLGAALLNANLTDRQTSQYVWATAVVTAGEQRCLVAYGSGPVMVMVGCSFQNRNRK